MQFSLLTLLWARSVVDNEVYQGKFRFLKHIWQSYPWPPVTSARDPELAERVLAGKKGMYKSTTEHTPAIQVLQMTPIISGSPNQIIVPEFPPWRHEKSALRPPQMQ